MSDPQSLRSLSTGARAASPRKECRCGVEQARHACSTPHPQTGERRRREQALVMEIRQTRSRTRQIAHQGNLTSYIISEASYINKRCACCIEKVQSLRGLLQPSNQPINIGQRRAIQKPLLAPAHLSIEPGHFTCIQLAATAVSSAGGIRACLCNRLRPSRWLNDQCCAASGAYLF